MEAYFPAHFSSLCPVVIAGNEKRLALIAFDHIQLRDKPLARVLVGRRTAGIREPCGVNVVSQEYDSTLFSGCVHVGFEEGKYGIRASHYGLTGISNQKYGLHRILAFGRGRFFPVLDGWVIVLGSNRLHNQQQDAGDGMP